MLRQDDPVLGAAIKRSDAKLNDKIRDLALAKDIGQWVSFGNELVKHKRAGILRENVRLHFLQACPKAEEMQQIITSLQPAPPEDRSFGRRS